MPKQIRTRPNDLFRNERLRHHWTQKEVAERIGVTVVTINRWERGVTSPSPYYRLKLCQLFEKQGHQLGFFPLPDEQGVQPLFTVQENASPRLCDPALPLPRNETRRLIGRDALVADLAVRLCSHPGSLALTGLPGIGKTALSIALSHHAAIREHFRDGILWVGLGQTPPLLEFLSRWGRLLGLSMTELGSLTTLDAWTRHLHDCIGDRQMLIIIDDAWELAEAMAFRLGGHNCVHLLTTRFPAIAWPFARENVLQVQELGNQDSILLLNHLAPQVVQESPTADIEDLVALVGGLPLALTLVGGYLYTQAQSGQPRRWQTALEQLRYDVNARLQIAAYQLPWESAPSLPMGTLLSLEAAIEVSEQRLPIHAQDALRAVSVFPSKPHSFSEEAAREICQIEVEVLDRLLDSGLLDSAQPGRYQMHQTIADYARSRQTDPSVAERLVRFFVAFIHVHHSDFDGLERELASIVIAFKIAFERSMFRSFIRGVLAFEPFLEARRHYRLAHTLLTQMQKATRLIADDEGLVATWFFVGRMAELRSDLREAEKAYLDGLTLAEQMGHRQYIGRFLISVGGVKVDQGDFAHAESALEEGLAIVNECNDQDYVCLALKNLGEVVDSKGETSKANELYEQALVAARQRENWEIVSALLQNKGVKAARRGAYAQAAALYEEGLIYAQRMSNLQRQSAILMNQGMLAMHQQRYPEALALSLESLRLARVIINRLRMSSVLQNLGIIETQLGHDAQAEDYFRESLELAREIGHRWLMCETQVEWGMLYLRQQQVVQARRLFEAMLAEARDMGAHLLEAQVFFGLAQVEASEGKKKEALSWAQKSKQLFEQLEDVHHPLVADWLATFPASQKDTGRARSVPIHVSREGSEDE